MLSACAGTAPVRAVMRFDATQTGWPVVPTWVYEDRVPPTGDLRALMGGTFSCLLQHHHALPGTYGRTWLYANLAHGTGDRRSQRDFHFHGFQNHQYVTGFDAGTFLDLHLPEVAGDMAIDAVPAGLERRVLADLGHAFVTFEMRLTGVDPALALGGER